MIQRFSITKGSLQQEQQPFVRVVLDGGGCGEPGCHCSPPNFISLGDGEVGLTVALSAEQAKALINDRLLLFRVKEG